MLSGMFVVSEAEAVAIRAAYERGGELAAAVELRRHFPGIDSTAKARECARTCWVEAAAAAAQDGATGRAAPICGQRWSHDHAARQSAPQP
jgi:hypothetical protein